MGVIESMSPTVEGRSGLIEHLESGNKPSTHWRIGTEHEKFAYSLDDLRPLPYEGERGIQALLEGLAERFGWKMYREGGNVIALEYQNQHISLEPGGQFELSGTPLETIHETCIEVNNHLAQVKAIAADLNIGLLGLGFNPKWAVSDIPAMPKQRYRMMRQYMPTRGTRGLDMMFRTCTVQVNLDYQSEADMVKKFRVALALQPVATALFANSPFTEGRPNGFQSYRAWAWQDTDPDRTGIIPFVFEDGMGFERYTDWALDVPMYFVQRQGQYLEVGGQTFREFLDGRLRALPGQRSTLADWDTHLTTCFPEVRLKRYLELRGADGGPWSRLCALPALWVGILYDSASLDAAWDLVKNWTAADRMAMYLAVPQEGLDAPAPAGSPGPTVLSLAREMVTLSSAGLERRNRRGSRGRDETHYLDPLREIVATGKTPATLLLEKFHGPWGGSIDPVFKEYAY